MKDEITHEFNEISYGNGNLYHGDIKLTNGKDPVMDGKGILYFPNGNYYVGDFKDEKMEGLGMYFFCDSKNFVVSQFKNNMSNGLGIYHYKDKGNLYKGNFKDRIIFYSNSGYFKIVNVPFFIDECDK